ncbi:hypothetical protein BO83DRAFT_387083 [Aspergillus eucalypticola CBS 122712]|uniref:Zn(2)-C6 fungal-type domain-containing protein n=1 Tax=Aspergillus eucalypticola (strain CBS 122712 / IBT 29274) TaxID=1448314 RepID=A0A317VXZ8_ASPEC|nr:uncharacterized protein BO83DRAFT_387083 [Aspergillus eucalypticola CBS 122712]PWY77892.1 hypothetical protein BO83DRAFT_387083 [Aspergillus eucalypticola CBS 122712]
MPQSQTIVEGWLSLVKVCRRKRINCDGAKPSCAGCLSYAENCEYKYDKEKRNRSLTRTRPPTKQHIQALNARIFLELQLAHYQPQGRGIISEITHQLQSQDDKVGNKDISGAQSQYLDPIDDITDVLGGLSIEEGDQPRYFGSRSNLSFMERQGAKPFTFRQNPNPPLQPIDNPWQNLVYQKVFLRSLEARLDDGYCAPLLLHSMLALAARYSDDPKVRTVPNGSSTAGDGLSQKAQALLFEEIKAPRVSTK